MGWALAWIGLALAGEPLLLDAGGAGSPVQPGFARLDPDGSTDPRASWEKAPPRPARWVGEPDALAGDWIRPGGVLHLALDPGAWVVHLMLGEVSRVAGPPWFHARPGSTVGVRVDGAPRLTEEVPDGEAFLASPWYALAPFPRFAPDETEWDRQIAPRHRWRTLSVEVGPDGLTLEPFGIALQGLVAYPADDVALGEVLLETTALTRRAYYETHVAPESTLTSTPPPGEGPLTARILPWDEAPDAAEADRQATIAWALARDERRGTAVWVTPGDGPVTWEVVGLDGLEVEGHAIHWLDQRTHHARLRRPRPAFLRPSDGTLAGDQGVPIGLGLVVRAPVDAHPGVRAGRLVFRRGPEVLEVPLRIRVRDLDLDPLPVPVGFFADVRLSGTLAGGNDSPLARATLDADLDLMRAMGCTAVALGRASPWPGPWRAPDLADPALFAYAVHGWRARGGDPFIWMDPFTELAPALRSPERADAPARIDRAAALARAATALDVPIYVYDEEGGRSLDTIARGAEIAATLREAAPGVRLAAAIPNPVDWDHAGTWDIAMTTHQPRALSATTERIRGTGASAWSYNLVPGRAAPGLLLWGLGSEGLLQWHWNDFGGDPFDDVHSKVQHQYAIGAPEAGVVWPTVLLASFAEGIVDHRHLATLARLVAEGERSRSPRRREIAAHGRRLLDAARVSVDGSWPVGVHDGAIWSERSLTHLRDAAADLAEALASRRPTPRAAAPEPVAEPKDLVWHATPIERLPTRTSWALPPPSGVPFVESAPIAVDGRLDDAAWSQGPPAPPLRPVPEGPGVPDGALRVAVTPDGLAIAVSDLDEAHHARILVDPDGTAQRWFVAHLDAAPTFQACGFPPLTLPVERFLHTHAAPCRALDAPPHFARGDGTLEVLWPWALLGRTTGSLRVGWQIADASGPLGTWARGASRSFGPDDAVPLDTGRTPAWLRVSTSPRATERATTLRAAGGPTGTWSWEVSDRGMTLETGEVELDGIEAPFSFTDPGRELFTVLAIAPEDGPLPLTAITRARWDTSDLRVVTPAFDDAVEIAWRAPVDLTDLVVRVRSADGALLGESAVHLGAGSGALTIAADPTWPDAIEVHAEGFGPIGGALRRRSRGAP